MAVLGPFFSSWNKITKERFYLKSYSESGCVLVFANFLFMRTFRPKKLCKTYINVPQKIDSHAFSCTPNTQNFRTANYLTKVKITTSTVQKVTNEIYVPLLTILTNCTTDTYFVYNPPLLTHTQYTNPWKATKYICIMVIFRQILPPLHNFQNQQKFPKFFASKWLKFTNDTSDDVKIRDLCSKLFI